MRTRRPLISAVLALALLLGQWLAAAHDSDHGLQAGAAHACAVCVYSHAGGLLPAVVALQLDDAVAAPDAPARAVALAITRRHHPIRGPPALLV